MKGFVADAPTTIERYASCLQGTAMVERMAYEILDEATGSRDGQVYATGGASRSDVWLQCRASVCGRVMHRTEHPEAAMGAAILAAAGTEFPDVSVAMGAMTRIIHSVEPTPQAVYEDAYARFCERLPVKSLQNMI